MKDAKDALTYIKHHLTDEKIKADVLRILCKYDYKLIWKDDDGNEISLELRSEEILTVFSRIYVYYTGILMIGWSKEFYKVEVAIGALDENNKAKKCWAELIYTIDFRLVTIDFFLE